MSDISSISAAFTAIKSASEILKVIRDAGQKLESAEYNLKFAELTESLSELRIYISELRETISDKEQQIKNLNDTLKIKADIVRYRDAYYEKDEKGSPTGNPFCSKCWEVNHVLIHLTRNTRPSNIDKCPNCGNLFQMQKVFETKVE